MTKETYELQTGEHPVNGFSRVNRISEGDARWGQSPDSAHVERVAEAATFLSEVMSGRAPSWALKEAIAPSWAGQSDVVIRNNYPGLYREGYTTSDFPFLMGDVLDRMMLNNYNSLGHDFRSYVKVSRPLRDFRSVRRLALNGAEGQYQKITGQEGLKYSQTLDVDNYTYAPELYGLGVKLSFRAFMNDDLDAFDSIPTRLGRGGRRTVEKFITELFFDANGPDATFFSSGNGNRLSGNPDFAIDSLGTAMGQLMDMTDTDGEPIVVEGVTLLYGSGTLHVTVNNVLNQLSVDVTASGGVSGQTIRVNNWIIKNIKAVYNPYIPIVATTNGATSWALFANPNSGRPAGEIGFLAGFEQPALFQKAPNAQRVGGGLESGVGDFATMETHYKGIIGIGGAVLDPKSAVASDGKNS